MCLCMSHHVSLTDRFSFTAVRIRCLSEVNVEHIYSVWDTDLRDVVD